MAEKNRGTRTGAEVPGGEGTGAAKRAGARNGATRTAGAANGPQDAAGVAVKKGAAAKGAGGKGTGVETAAAAPAAKSAGSKTAGAKAAGAKSGGRARPAGAKAAGSAPDLRSDLRDFASGRPEGWSHDDWLSFLEHLQSRGHNISEREEIGRALERERLDIALERVDGLPAQARQTLVERFGTVWSLRNADPDEVSRQGGIDRSLADRIREQLG